MCLIIASDPATTTGVPSLADIKKAATTNRDGVGICWAERGKLHIWKQVTIDAEEVHRRITGLTEAKLPWFVHFRFATTGAVCLANCHPAQLGQDVAIAHNGCISGYGNAKVSDTRQFLKRFNGLYPASYHSNTFHESVIKLAGAGNKFAVLTSDGKLSVINRSAGCEEKTDGLWYSNTYWRGLGIHGGYGDYDYWEDGDPTRGEYMFIKDGSKRYVYGDNSYWDPQREPNAIGKGTRGGWVYLDYAPIDLPRNAAIKAAREKSKPKPAPIKWAGNKRYQWSDELDLWVAPGSVCKNNDELRADIIDRLQPATATNGSRARAIRDIHGVEFRTTGTAYIRKLHYNACFFGITTDEVIMECDGFNTDEIYYLDEREYAAVVQVKDGTWLANAKLETYIKEKYAATLEALQMGSLSPGRSDRFMCREDGSVQVRSSTEPQIILPGSFECTDDKLICPECGVSSTLKDVANSGGICPWCSEPAWTQTQIADLAAAEELREEYSMSLIGAE